MWSRSPFPVKYLDTAVPSPLMHCKARFTLQLGDSVAIEKGRFFGIVNLCDYFISQNLRLWKSGGKRKKTEYSLSSLLLHI